MPETTNRAIKNLDPVGIEPTPRAAPVAWPKKRRQMRQQVCTALHSITLCPSIYHHGLCALRTTDCLLKVPRKRLKTGERSFSHFGPVTWNQLPYEIRKSPSLETFKTRLKTFYFHNNPFFSLSVVYVKEIVMRPDPRPSERSCAQ